MVFEQLDQLTEFHPLSVLALSSRFDGLAEQLQLTSPLNCFSTRSVESF